MTLARPVGALHAALVYSRRIAALAHAIAPLMAEGPALDVGCGDGTLAGRLAALRPDTRIFGLEVLLRLQAPLPVILYDGGPFPFATQSFSTVLIADALHHAPRPISVLRECLRVSRGAVIVKDHFGDTALQRILLRALDWSGNAAHGVSLPYHYFSRASWAHAIAGLQARETFRIEEVDGQYVWPLQAWLGKGIQFVSKLEKTEKPT